MTSNLQITSSQEGFLATLAKIEGQTWLQILDAIENHDYTQQDQRTLARIFKDFVGGEDAADIEAGIYFIQNIAENRRMSVEDVFDSILQDLQSSLRSGLSIQRTHIVQAANAALVRRTYAAEKAAIDHSRVLTSASVNLETRPIFEKITENADATLNGFSAYYSIRVNFVDATQPRSITLACDDRDLRLLEAAIKEARSNATRLKDSMRNVRATPVVVAEEE